MTNEDALAIFLVIRMGHCVSLTDATRALKIMSKFAPKFNAAVDDATLINKYSLKNLEVFQ
jgi:hypothetical protein